MAVPLPIGTFAVPLPSLADDRLSILVFGPGVGELILVRVPPSRGWWGRLWAGEIDYAVAALALPVTEHHPPHSPARGSQPGSGGSSRRDTPDRKEAWPRSGWCASRRTSRPRFIAGGRSRRSRRSSSGGRLTAVVGRNAGDVSARGRDACACSRPRGGAPSRWTVAADRAQRDLDALRWRAGRASCGRIWSRSRHGWSHGLDRSGSR